MTTPRGPIAIVLHRIRYFGHVSLCVAESDANGTNQSCANYPLGPTSNQDIGHSPVWWATDYASACTRPAFQVVSGVVLRSGLTAWLHTPAGVSRMPTASIPKAFGVAGGLLYATINTSPDSVTLENAAGATVYTAAVASLDGLPTLGCGSATSRSVIGGGVTVSSSSAIVLHRAGSKIVP